MGHLNYNHLHYFWVVATEGSIARASEKLFLTPQTISGQLRTLEEALGAKLFKRSGRNLALTETGQVVLSYADDMFRLGSELRDVVRGRLPGSALTFNVGVANVVPKLIAYRVLEPALRLEQPVRMICHEAPLESLLADLAMHKLDLVLSDSPVSPTVNVRLFNHLLGECGVSFFAVRREAKRYARTFPQSLSSAPLLLPASGTALRRALEQWFEREGLEPKIIGEFEDSALMKAFGHAGAGLFMGPSAIEAELCEQNQVQSVGRTDTVVERFYVISAERRLKHPAVLAVADSARARLFG